jgi:purine-nucleoside phosphorylase
VNAADRLTTFGARVGMVMGSGLSPLAGGLDVELVVPYADMPGIPSPSVDGHPGNFLAARLNGVRVLVALGRVHMYEGWEAGEVVRGIRAMHACGVRCLVLTNAAGAVRQGMSPGSWMMIADHINLTGQSPLRGSGKFIDMSTVYSPRLRLALLEAAARGGIPLAEGVYAAMPGPQYETPAEIKMLGVLGADAVGMSTVPEAIEARALGMEICGLSCITNLAAGLGDTPLDHAGVLETGRAAADAFRVLITGSITAIEARAREVALAEMPGSGQQIPA